MGFQVSANFAALNAYNSLGAHQTKASSALVRISSGLKASGAGDIASQGTAAALNQSMLANQSSAIQVQYALSQLQSADAIYGELISLSQRGIQVASQGLVAGADFAAVDAQVQAIQVGLDSIQTNSLFNGVDPLTEAAAPNVGGAALTVTPPVPTAIPTVAAITTTTLAGDAVDDFVAVIDSTVDDRATNAGNIASLQNTLQVLNAMVANDAAGMSQFQDTDIALEMMNLTSANIMTDAATAMLAQAMQMPNSVLRLLQ